MGNKYVRERPLEEIIQKLLTPQEEEEEKAEVVAEVPVPNSPSPTITDPKASALSAKKTSVPNLKDVKEKTQANEPVVTIEVEEKEEVKEQPIKFLANDYMEKAEMSPPKDPYGNDTMHPNLIITPDKLMNVV